MQIVHILGDDRNLIILFQFCQQSVTAIRFSMFQLPPPFVVKTQHQFLIALEGFRRGDVVNAVLLSQTAVVTKSGQPAFRTHAGTGEHHDVIFHVRPPQNQRGSGFFRLWIRTPYC